MQMCDKRGLAAFKGYEGSDDEEWVEDVRLEGEERQAHVGEDEVLCQEVQQFKQLKGSRRAHTSSFLPAPTLPAIPHSHFKHLKLHYLNIYTF